MPVLQLRTQSLYCTYGASSAIWRSSLPSCCLTSPAAAPRPPVIDLVEELLSEPVEDGGGWNFWALRAAAATPPCPQRATAAQVLDVHLKEPRTCPLLTCLAVKPAFLLSAFLSKQISENVVYVCGFLKTHLRKCAPVFKNSFPKGVDELFVSPVSALAAM